MADARDKIFGTTLPFLSMIVGSKHSGKSELVKFITYQYASAFSYVVVVSPTALNGFYSTFIPAGHIHSTYSDELIDSIKNKQETLKNAGKPVQMLLILDDILASPDVHFEKRQGSVLNLLFTANRHWNISLLIVTQKLRGLPPACRENADFVCITRCMRSAWGNLYDEYGTSSKEEFFQMLQECTSDYKVLMFKANVASANDHFSCFKVPSEFLKRRFRLSY